MLVGKRKWISKQRRLEFAIRHGSLAAAAAMALIAAVPGRAVAQIPQITVAGLPTPSPSPKPSASPPPPAPTPVPMADVVTAAESAQVNLRNMEEDLSSDPVMTSATSDLPTFMRELSARLDENSRLLSANPSLDTLKSIGNDWRQQSAALSQWIKDLTGRASQLDREIDTLAQLDVTWEQTLARIKGTDAPPDIVARIKAIISRADSVGEKLAKRRSDVLELQNSVVDEATKVADARTAVHFARDEAISRLFVSDSPPIWSRDVLTRTGSTFSEDTQSSITAQLVGLGAYARRQEARFLLHVLVALILIVTLRGVSTKISPMRMADSDLNDATKVFDAPISTGIVLSLLLCVWIYPEAPRLLWAIIGGIALVPTTFLLKHITERHLFSIIKALLVFYFVDQLRSIAASLPVLPRFLFLGEILAASLFLVWLIRSTRPATSGIERIDHFRRTVLIASRIALALFTVGFVANGLGYVSLANLVGDAVLRSADFGVFLFALLRIFDAVILVSLRVRPFRLLGMVDRHNQVLYQRIHRFVAGIAILLWTIRTLDLLSLLGVVFEYGQKSLRATAVLGSVRLSLGNVLAFAITVWASVLLSRFLRFLLDEDIYPRLSLPRGLPYAISTMLHYAVLVSGFFIAVAAMGFDMTKFTILAGAFGVGLGFGLQNIVNNFVSGLILLFERPVNVGDVIQMDDASGVVQSIGIRASIIRTSSGSEIIVPNGKLISDRVTNWTLSNNLRGIVIPMTVTSSADPQHVIEVLNAVATAHEGVSKNPPPQALFIKFGPATLEFELHAWTDQFSTWEQIRSDLAVAINTAFNKESITMP